MDLVTAVCVRQLYRNTGTDIAEIRCTAFPGRNILSNIDCQVLITKLEIGSLTVLPGLGRQRLTGS